MTLRIWNEPKVTVMRERREKVVNVDPGTFVDGKVDCPSAQHLVAHNSGGIRLSRTEKDQVDSSLLGEVEEPLQKPWFLAHMVRITVVA
jgi:hypothetical protein